MAKGVSADDPNERKHRAIVPPGDGIGPSPEISTQILALETSGREASVAVLESAGGELQLLREIALSAEQRTAQALAPAVRELLDAVEWCPQTVKLIAVVIGPGSFTGLRIGVTFAKTFAYAVDAHVVGVNALAVLAEQAGSTSMPLWTVMDAQRQELYAARWENPGGIEKGADPTRILPIAEWLSALRPGDSVTGLPLHKLRPKLSADVRVVDPRQWRPMAGSVGVVGWRSVLRGKTEDMWKLAPRYYRLSAAEEKRLAP